MLSPALFTGLRASFHTIFMSLMRTLVVVVPVCRRLRGGIQYWLHAGPVLRPSKRYFQVYGDTPSASLDMGCRKRRSERSRVMVAMQEIRLAGGSLGG